MSAVVDSSVLIALSIVGRLGLLSQRFPDGILVPQAVWREVVEGGEGQAGAREVAAADWISVCGVRDRDQVAVLNMELDEGEAEAIALCRERSIELVLLDEKDARRVARRLGLSVLGTVGVLIWGRRSGLIADLRENLDALQTLGRFRLSRSVYDEALRAVGELEQTK